MQEINSLFIIFLLWFLMVTLFYWQLMIRKLNNWKRRGNIFRKNSFFYAKTGSRECLNHSFAWLDLPLERMMHQWFHICNKELSSMCIVEHNSLLFLYFLRNEIEIDTSYRHRHSLCLYIALTQNLIDLIKFSSYTMILAID